MKKNFYLFLFATFQSFCAEKHLPLLDPNMIGLDGTGQDIARVVLNPFLDQVFAPDNSNPESSPLPFAQVNQSLLQARAAETAITALGQIVADGETSKEPLANVNKQKFLECPYCKKAFLFESKLQTHISSHTDTPEKIRPHQCTINGCTRRFTLRQNLKRHQKNDHQSTS
jgi:uncharacterized Zn-finger protein